MDGERSFQQELHKLEVRLLQPEIRRSRADLEELLADDFVEIGSSGRKCDRQSIIKALAQELEIRIEMFDFQAVLLSSDVALATYRAEFAACEGKPAKRSLRSSIWRFRKGRWQMIFHQGTPISGR
jgi:hypothetical protein